MGTTTPGGKSLQLKSWNYEQSFMSITLHRVNNYAPLSKGNSILFYLWNVKLSLCQFVHNSTISTVVNQASTLAQKTNSSPFHLQILKWPDWVQERAMSHFYSNEPHYLPELHLVILKFANEKAGSFFFWGSVFKIDIEETMKHLNNVHSQNQVPLAPEYPCVAA